MRYVVALFCPPLAVLMCGKPVQAVINFGLCFLLWVPGAVHAWTIVGETFADNRANRQVKGFGRELRRRA